MPCQHAGSAPSRAVPRPHTRCVHDLATTTLSRYSASGTLIFTRPLPLETKQYNTRHRYDTHHGNDMLLGSAAARLWPGCDSAAAGCSKAARLDCADSAVALLAAQPGREPAHLQVRRSDGGDGGDGSTTATVTMEADELVRRERHLPSKAVAVLSQ